MGAPPPPPLPAGGTGVRPGEGELPPAHLSVSPQPHTLPSASALTAILPILRFMVREMTARHFLPSLVPLLLTASSALALLPSSSGICQRHGE